MREEGEVETAETEEDSVIMRGDNLPIVDLSKYNTDGKEAKYIQINHIVGKLTANKKVTEDHIKKAEFVFMMDLKTMIANTAIDPELARVRTSMQREVSYTYVGVPVSWIGDTTFRPLRNSEDDVRSKNILVAGHEEGHRK